MALPAIKHPPIDMVVADAALGKAKITLMAEDNCIFFCTVMLSLKHIWDLTCPTAYTDGRVIGYNPYFFMGLSEPERVGLILHETLHVALMHVLRGLGFDHKRFNKAADYVINLIVVMVAKASRGLIALPKGGLYDTQYKGMNTEQVYALMDDILPPDFMEDIRPMDDPDSEEGKKLKDELDDILVQAVMQSQAANEDPGAIPGDLARYVKNLIKPEMPWNRILRNLASGLARDDYSMRRPSRRVMADYILPSLYSEKLMNIATATDVSGSILDKQFDAFVSEDFSIMKMLNPQELTFIQFDHIIQKVDVIRTVADLGKVEFHGGGGTNIEPVMEWAKKNKPACLIVFTDGEYAPPRINPRVPVFWIVYGRNQKRFRAPFGKTILFKFKE